MTIPSIFNYQFAGDSMLLRLALKHGDDPPPFAGYRSEWGLCKGGKTIHELHDDLSDLYGGTINLLVVMIGTNDILKMVDSDFQLGKEKSRIRHSLQQLKAKLYRKCEDIKWCTVPPIPRLMMKQDEVVSRYNCLHKAVNNEITSFKDGRISVIDICHYFMETPNLESLYERMSNNVGVALFAADSVSCCGNNFTNLQELSTHIRNSHGGLSVFDYSEIGDDFEVTHWGYKKDTVDFEWNTWMPWIVFVLPPWIAVHILLAEGARWISPQAVPAVHSLVTILFLLQNFGLVCVFFALSQVLLYYIILRLKSIILVWFFGVPSLLLSGFVLQEIWIYISNDEKLFMLMSVSTAWVHLRCTSFSLETIAAPSHKSHWRTFYNLLGYALYLPTYFFGPFIIYTNFGPFVYRPFKLWTLNHLRTFLLNVLRYYFWAAVTEALLYFLYIHALQLHIDMIASLGPWTLCGEGFLLGMFFGLKYIVVYGLFSTVARFDGYAAPAPPCCVARIHLYTDMWRNFDIGFYQFIHRYIYSPLLGHRKQLVYRLMASSVCFVFVFLWHGVQLTVFCWSLFNFLGISLVAFATSLSKNSKWKELMPSGVAGRRIKALLAAPLFVLSVISSFYFISGLETGNAFLTYLFIRGSWDVMIGLIFVAYCMCQVSIEFKQREMKQKSS